MIQRTSATERPDKRGKAYRRCCWRCRCCCCWRCRRCCCLHNQYWRHTLPCKKRQRILNCSRYPSPAPYTLLYHRPFLIVYRSPIVIPNLLISKREMVNRAIIQLIDIVSSGRSMICLYRQALVYNGVHSTAFSKLLFVKQQLLHPLSTYNASP